jgi:hypothetical protein
MKLCNLKIIQACKSCYPYKPADIKATQRGNLKYYSNKELITGSFTVTGYLALSSNNHSFSR